MPVPAAARRLARLAARRPSAPARRLRLAVESLEDRAVPANTLSIAGHGAGLDANISVSAPVGGTVTIATTDGSAVLSLTTLEAQLTNPAVTNVVVTTAVAAGGTDADEIGNIEWDETPIGEGLDFTDFGTGKTLTLRTAAGASAFGNINLTAVHFLNDGTDDQISLAFDTSATDGIVTFGTDGFGSNTVIYSAEAVLDLTVNAGAGDFVFHDDGDLIGAADAGGAVSISAGVVDLSHQGGLTAGTTMSVSGTDVLLDIGTGLYAVNDLTVTGTNSVTADTGGLTSETGDLIVTAPDVALTQMILLAEGNLTVSGDNSVQLSTTGFGGAAQSTRGDVLITGGTVDLPFTSLWADDGDITVSGTDVSGWFDGFAPNGQFVIAGTNSVTLTDASANDVEGVTVTGGTVTMDGVIFFPLGRADITVTGTDVTLTNTQLDAQDGSVTVTGTNIVMDLAILGAPGDITVTGPVTIGPGGAFLANGGSQGTITFTDTVDAATDGEPDLEMAAGTIVFQQSVGATAGLNSLTIRHGDTTVRGNTLNAATITLFDPIQAPFPDPDQTTPATLGINGTVTGNIIANASPIGGGGLAPGGRGTVGTMTVRGDVTLNADFDLDLAVVPGGPTDQLIVVDNPNTIGTTEGKLTIGPASNLGQSGVGQAPRPSAQVIHADAGRAGEFANAPDGTNLLLGTDYVTVTYPNTTDVVIVPAPGQGKVVKGVDEDGTLYTVTVTGPGTLVHGKDQFGRLFLVVRDATAASKVAITTRANASDDVVTFGAGILVNNSLASLTAPKVNIGDQFRSSGPVGLATFRDFLDFNGSGIALGGTALNKTTITARNIFDDVKVGATLTALKVAQNLSAPFVNPFAEPVTVTAPAIGTLTARSATADVTTAGKLGTMTVAGDYTGEVTAGSVGRFQAAGGTATLTAAGAVGPIVSTGPTGLTLAVTAAKVASVKVAGTLSGGGSPWDVTGGITSLTAGSVEGVELKAGYLGTVLVKGNLATGLSGDIRFSTFTLTSNSGPSAGSFGIRSLTAKGTVDNSLFDVKAGHVGTFTVGRFHTSQLYLNYTPPDFPETFDTGGAFGGQGFKLGAFKTTAAPLGDPSHPLNWAFVNSEIAADAVGTITLSGLQTDNSDHGGFAFGIKVRTSPGVVKVLAADAAVPPTLTPDSAAPYDPIAGNFFFIDV